MELGAEQHRIEACDLKKKGKKDAEIIEPET